jgi:flagellar assembly protein FliH
MGVVIQRESAATAAAFSFQDVERQAHDILTRARAQAAQHLIEAEVRARQLAELRRREGHEQGLAEGRRLGMEQVKQEARQAAIQAAHAELAYLKQALATALTEYESRKHRLIAQAESGLIELALAIARRVCKVCVDHSATPVEANIRAVLEMVKHRDDAELRVHSAEYERLAGVAPDLLKRIAELEHVTLTPDSAVARGGCVLQTRDGTVDASVAGQLERIAAALGHVAGQELS